MEEVKPKSVYYSDYLQLDKILDAQLPESEKAGVQADDEMLFIIIHQTYELWFKQILHELGIAQRVFQQSNINDNSPDLPNVVHRLNRVSEILEVLIDQMFVLETMTPLDFLDFRNLLRPASGFQSIQFKIVEASLGLRYKQRFGQQYYLSQLRPEDVERVKKAEESTSLIELINTWLERMPYFKDAAYWQAELEATKPHPFWQQYRDAYANGLLEIEKSNLIGFDMLFMNDENYPEDRRLSPEANRNALFIMLYRDYPLLNMPYRLLEMLLNIDELLAQWRYRHMNMVQRMIGRRVGTGGSTGAEYLKNAADSHYVFKEIADLTSYLMPRQDMPKLSSKLQRDLGYNKF